MHDMTLGNEPAGVPAAPAAIPTFGAVPAQRTEYPLQFTGSGGEYFRIWIVNLLLTIVTVGIYSAWAKVRKLQYFYRNTQLDGNVFDYHGKPLAILKGRAIALALVLFYNFAFKYSPTLAVVAMALMAAVLPWLLVQSLRFKAYNTSYRGLRFRFSGAVAEGYKVFGVPILLVLGAGVLFGLSVAEDEFERPWLAIAGAVLYALFALLLPWFHWRLKAYQHNDASYGQARGRFRGRVRRFYAIYGLALLLLVGATALAAGVIGGTIYLGIKEAKSAALMGIIVGVLSVILFYLTLLAVAPFVQARLQNHVWNSTLLGSVGFDSRLKARRLTWIAITNLVLIIATLGLFTPFAAVRLYRARVEAVNVLALGSLGAYVAQQQATQVGATGEGAADLLDLDFAL